MATLWGTPSVNDGPQTYEVTTPLAVGVLRLLDERDLAIRMRDAAREASARDLEERRAFATEVRVLQAELRTLKAKRWAEVEATRPPAVIEEIAEYLDSVWSIDCGNDVRDGKWRSK